MPERECSIDECEFTTDSPLGSASHARAHRNEFARLVGRPPEDYDEVRRLFNTDWTPEDLADPVDAAGCRRPTLEAFGGEGE